MKISLDLSGARFDCLDMDFACVHFAPPRQLGESLLIEFWGLVLRTSKAAISIPQLPFLSLEHSVFVNGWTQLQFEAPQVVEITLALYDRGGTHFIADAKGQPIVLERKLESGAVAAAYEYPLGGELLLAARRCSNFAAIVRAGDGLLFLRRLYSCGKF